MTHRRGDELASPAFDARTEGTASARDAQRITSVLIDGC